MKNKVTDPVESVLRNALEALGPHGENWVKIGRKSVGNMRSKCAALAISEQPVSQEFIQRAKIILCDSIGIDVMDLYRWNDAPERTWPEVKAAYEKAIKKAAL